MTRKEFDAIKFEKGIKARVLWCGKPRVFSVYTINFCALDIGITGPNDTGHVPMKDIIEIITKQSNRR